VYPALIAWLRHRPDRGPHPQDSTLHPYVGVVATTMWVWIGASVLEVFAVHFLLPWPLARWIPLIITSGG
jgi:hypothetical protein